ncbi:MAG: peptide chain release factor 2 [Candidatus Aerophobetes bacterium]
MDGLRGYLDAAQDKSRIEELEKETSRANFWEREDGSQLLKELSRLKDKRKGWSELTRTYQEVATLEELLREEEDLDLEKELKRKLVWLEKQLEELELHSLLGGKYDSSNAILSVHPGAGGTDSCDWAERLVLMYLGWINRKGYSSRIVEWMAGEEAGVKTATLVVEGEFAYGYLKQEVGIHRLVRISPFDAASRRHTSFAAVDVIPETQDLEVEIKESDLKIDTFRASGPGGQHVNVTDSAIRITHLPTGVIVQCQDQRSQHKNKTMAMRILKARLHNLYELEKEKEIKKRHQDKARIEWGSQVRSYVLHPYTMVKDHRSGLETANVDKVLKGEIDDFIIASLKKSAGFSGKNDPG